MHVCVFVITATAVAVSAANATSQDIREQVDRFLSCRGRCGLQEGVACSCHVTCVVYRNCCDDFLSQCPSDHDEAVARFGTMMATAQPVCLRSGYHAVSGCPGGQAGGQAHVGCQGHDRDQGHDGRVGHGWNQAQPTSRDTELFPFTFLGEILYAYEIAPYSDLSTGLVYSTKRTFLCNTNTPPSSARGVRWQVSFSILDSDYGDLLETIGSYLEVHCPLYLPPLREAIHTTDTPLGVNSPAAVAASACEPEVLAPCHVDVEGEDEEADLCRSQPISYVTDGVSVTVYRNKHCMTCMRRFRDDVTVVPHIYRQVPVAGCAGQFQTYKPLSVLINLSGGNTMELTLTKTTWSGGDGEEVGDLDWQHAVCDLDILGGMTEDGLQLDRDVACVPVEDTALRPSDWSQTEIPSPASVTTDWSQTERLPTPSVTTHIFDMFPPPRCTQPAQVSGRPCEKVQLLIRMSDSLSGFIDVEMKALLNTWSCFLTNILGFDVSRNSLLLPLRVNEAGMYPLLTYTSAHEISTFDIGRLRRYFALSPIAQRVCNDFLKSIALARRKIFDSSHATTSPSKVKRRTAEGKQVEGCISVLPEEKCLVEMEYKHQLSELGLEGGSTECMEKYFNVMINVSISWRPQSSAEAVCSGDVCSVWLVILMMGVCVIHMLS